jgi:hypothetical protein
MDHSLFSNTTHQSKNITNIVKCDCDRKFLSKYGNVVTCDCDRNNFYKPAYLVGGGNSNIPRMVNDSNIEEYLYPISDSASPFADLVDTESVQNDNDNANNDNNIAIPSTNGESQPKAGQQGGRMMANKKNGKVAYMQAKSDYLKLSTINH